MKIFSKFFSSFRLICCLLKCEYSPAIQENRVTTVQCLSGTGSLRVGGEILAKHYHEVSNILFTLFCLSNISNMTPYYKMSNL